MIAVAALQGILDRQEGVRLKPYRDTVGKLTIGVGRNLDDVGISTAEAMLLLADDIARTEAALTAAHPWWLALDDVRQEALVDMAFNMGEHTLDQFVNTLALIQSGQYGAAADAMLHSTWATQVGQRAVTLAQMIRTGAGG